MSRSTSGLDDIDGDDCVAATTATAATSAAVAATGRSTTGVDDIDDDDAPSSSSHGAAAIATASTSSAATVAASSTASAAASSSSSSASAAEEIARILNVLASDESLALLAAPPASSSSSSSDSAASARPPAPPVADHFAMLGVAPPQINAAGEGVWMVEDEQLKRAFKRLVLLIHPDKTPCVGAKAAFEAVKTAHATLSSDSSRYDYIRSYVAFRRLLSMRDASFMPMAAGVGSVTLEETLAQGKAIANIKAKQVSGFAARLQAQAQQKMQAARAGDFARNKREEQARQDELKRKIVESDSDSDEGGRHMSVAEKIRMAKGKQQKKSRML